MCHFYNSQAVQWLRLHPANGGEGSISGQGSSKDQHVAKRFLKKKKEVAINKY